MSCKYTSTGVYTCDKLSENFLGLGTSSTSIKCGPSNNNTKCPANQCCSTSGVCGGTKPVSSTYCSNTQKYYGIDQGIYDGMPTNTPAIPLSISTDGRCGAGIFKNTKCPGDQCCSSSNWCGGANTTADAWCTNTAVKSYGSSKGQYDGAISTIPAPQPSGNFINPIKWNPLAAPLTVTKDGKCGPANNNTKCPGNQCCSQFGWCGGDASGLAASDWCPNVTITYKFAGMNGMNEMNDGITVGTYDGIPVFPPNIQTTVSTNGKCGPLNNNTSCPGAQCCNSAGLCGGSSEKKSDYCNATISGISKRAGAVSQTITGSYVPTNKYDGLPFYLNN
jgi:hypothetical protein